jgi:copper chaperone
MGPTLTGQPPFEKRNLNSKHNQMETLQFKTNINCAGCIARVAPKLESTKGILNWKVDTANPNRVLTVETDNLSKDVVMAAVKEAGFNIQPL